MGDVQQGWTHLPWASLWMEEEPRRGKHQPGPLVPSLPQAFCPLSSPPACFRLLTSSHRPGDLLGTLSSDSVQDFSSSSSGRMEEFCEIDLPRAGKAESFSPAHSLQLPRNPSRLLCLPQDSLGEALLQLEPRRTTVGETLEGRERPQRGQGTLAAIGGQGPCSRGVPECSQGQGSW